MNAKHTSKLASLICVLICGVINPVQGFVVHLPSLPFSPATSWPHYSNYNRRTAAGDDDRGSMSALSASAAASALSTNTELLPGMDAIMAQNEELWEMLDDLRDKPYFRLYSVDMLASCEYMPQELFECYSETCEIYPVDEEEIPSRLKEVDDDEHDFELDGWARWDMPSDDYYDMLQFPEGFTGYDGSEVWRFIHDRIGFHDDEMVDDEYDADTWKADFNKAVSGLHAMVSAQVVRGIVEKIEAGDEFSDAEEVYSDPKAEFERRLGRNGETPLAIENMYFCYMLMLTAVSRARDRLLLDCECGRIGAEAAQILKGILDFDLLENTSISVASRTFHDHAVKDKDTLWEARMRTRDLMRIMNCVQCNKCRLHGKISVLGLSTALQLLVGQRGEGTADAEMTRVHRVELAALMTTLSKFATAIRFCQQMQEEIS
eukprot:scaffold15327_cov58-Attheya_sp.AAC.4